MPGKDSLSATNLANYHHFNCDLYLNNIYNDRSVEKSVKSAKAVDEVSKAQFKRGNDWEACLFTWLSEHDLLLRVPSNPLVAADLIENLALDEREHFFVAGLSFCPPEKEFAKRFALAGNAPVNFGIAKPDLLEIKRTPNGVTWKVIDAKASSGVKTSHHVQIYFYTLCLSYLLPAPYFTPATTAGVWLPPPDSFGEDPPSFQDLKEISIAILAPSLDTFLFNRVPKILALPSHDVPWHFGPLCRGCQYTQHCRDRAISDGELGAMSNITIDDARILRDVLQMTRSTSQLSDIEELGSILQNRPIFERLSRSSPLTMRRAKRILGISPRIRPDGQPIFSATLKAAQLRTVQIVPQRNFVLPSSEDNTVILSILQDPSTPGLGIAAFCLSIYHRGQPSPLVVHGPGTALVRSLAAQIRNLASLAPRTTQFYVFSPAEHSALQAHLIQAALTASNTQEDIQICIGALAQGASLLRTAFQPVVLSGALLAFLGKGQRSKAELVICLERLHLPTNGTVPVLRKRIQDFIEKNQEDSGSQERRRELGQLARVVILRRELEKLVALPIAGFWDLPECAAALSSDSKCPVQAVSDAEVYEAFVLGKSLHFLMQQRNRTIHHVLRRLRAIVASSSHNLLVNEARVLAPSFMDVCRVENLKKLSFMIQFEVLTKLTELWKSRIDGCPEAPILEFQKAVPGAKGLEYVFVLISGVLDIQGGEKDKDRAFYDYLLVADDTATSESVTHIPPEALFDDLGVSGLVFPLNHYTKARWDNQDAVVRQNLLLADLRDICSDGLFTKVVVRTWGGIGVQLEPGRQYRISPRLVDFNSTKVLSTLVELDFQCTGDTAKPSLPFLQLITNAKAFALNEEDPEVVKQLRKDSKRIQKLFRDLQGLDVEAAKHLVLKSSQNRAAQRILLHRLSVVWGPPGTGKTHTIALSILRLLEMKYDPGQSTRTVIFLTAMTHAAIDACLKKLSFLTKCYRSIVALPTAWLDQVHVEHVLQGNTHPGPPPTSNSYIYAGTVYQLYNYSKKHSFDVDCVVIDEAGQLALSSAALVLRSLSSTGKLIVAGDSEQLAPILTAQYPQLKTGALFGSVLDCLMFWSERPTGTVHSTRPSSPTFSDGDYGSQDTIVQLTENFRLNPDLGEFVSTIYSRAFKPQKVQARQLAASLKTVGQDLGSNFGVPGEIMEAIQWFLLGLSDAMVNRPQTILLPPPVSKLPKKDSRRISEIEQGHHPISLALIRLQTFYNSQRDKVGYEVHVRGEAAVAAALVVSLRRACPEDDIFVATPHRIQRQAVRTALTRINETDNLPAALAHMSLNDTSNESPKKGTVIVDTVERLQGSEAAFVICLFSLPQGSMSELSFLLERRRLNVAISRAKTLCILVVSPEVLCPSIKVLADPNSAKGFTFLKAFEDRAWSAPVQVNVDEL